MHCMISVRILTGHKQVSQGLNSRKGAGGFPFAKRSRTALGPIQSPIQWLLGTFSGVKRIEHEKQIIIMPRVSACVCLLYSRIIWSLNTEAL
jgi:hypothetical protein